MISKLMGNIALVTFSLFVCLFVLEFVVFRVVFEPSDLPILQQRHDGVLKYEPKQSGTYRIKGEISAEYSYNEDGWNSAHERYSLEKTKYRVAIVGDSFVDAIQVNYRDSLAEQLELLFSDDTVEVYRFGLSGAPLSQYTYMIEHEVMRYSPDLIVVVLVHNDFGQSLGGVTGEYTRSMLTYRIAKTGEIIEDPPERYRRGVISRLKQSALFRYLVVRQQHRELRPFFAQFLQRKEKTNVTIDSNLPRVQSNVEVSELSSPVNYLVAEHSFKKIASLASHESSKVLFLMDAARRETEAAGGTPDHTKLSALNVNQEIAKAAESANVDFLDLQSAVELDFIRNKEPFQFRLDSHWNEHMHKLVARSIYEWMCARPDYLERDLCA